MAMLTDEQRKLIVADYIECQSYNKVAKKYHISATTVKKWVLKDTDSVKKCEEKKEENTKSMLEYLDTLHEKKKKVVKLSLDALITKLSNVDRYLSAKDIAIAYGTVIDKDLKIFEIKNSKDDEILDKLDTLIEEQKNA